MIEFLSSFSLFRPHSSQEVKIREDIKSRSSYLRWTDRNLHILKRHTPFCSDDSKFHSPPTSTTDPRWGIAYTTYSLRMNWAIRVSNIKLYWPSLAENMHIQVGRKPYLDNFETFVFPEGFVAAFVRAFAGFGAAHTLHPISTTSSTLSLPWFFW